MPNLTKKQFKHKTNAFSKPSLSTNLTHVRHKTNKGKKEKKTHANDNQTTKNKELKYVRRYKSWIFEKKKIEFLNSPPKLELNIVLNVKQKQEWIMSTPLRLIKSLEVAPMNMARFGGKEVLRGVRL